MSYITFYNYITQKSIMICRFVQICANDENPYKDQSPGLLNLNVGVALAVFIGF